MGQSLDAHRTGDTVSTGHHPRLALRYDMRAAPFGCSHEQLYLAMLEQVRWADRMGCHSVIFSEHHGSDDGYLPSPVVAAAAAAGATARISIMISALILPLYDTVRPAEDLAVLDLISGGRLELVIGASRWAADHPRRLIPGLGPAGCSHRRRLLRGRSGLGRGVHPGL